VSADMNKFHMFVFNGEAKLACMPAKHILYCVCKFLFSTYEINGEITLISLLSYTYMVHSPLTK
jgi:hypothetical protein